jgi:hypothetical protein
MVFVGPGAPITAHHMKRLMVTTANRICDVLCATSKPNGGAGDDADGVGADGRRDASEDGWRRLESSL